MLRYPPYDKMVWPICEVIAEHKLPAIFPDMQIVMASPSFRWQDEALSVTTHKPNV